MTNRKERKGGYSSGRSAWKKKTAAGRFPSPTAVWLLPDQLMELAAEQAQDSLGRRVGLSQSGDTRLLQNLSLRHVRSFGRQVGVSDARLRRSQVVELGLRQADGEVEPILALTDNSLRAAERGNGVGEGGNRRLGAGL